MLLKMNLERFTNSLFIEKIQNTSFAYDSTFLKTIQALLVTGQLRVDEIRGTAILVVFSRALKSVPQLESHL